MWSNNQISFPARIAAAMACCSLFVGIACTGSERQFSDDLRDKFPETELPWVITESSYYEFGEWNWHDSVVERRDLQLLNDEELKSLHDTIGLLPEGLRGRFAAIQKARSADGFTVLLYRRDIGPVDDETGPDTLNHQFVLVAMDRKRSISDRFILSEWIPNYSLLTGTLDSAMNIQTTWISQAPGQDTIFTTWKWNSGGYWTNPK